MAFDIYTEVEDLIRKNYPKVEKISITPTGNPSVYSVGLSMGGMALSGNVVGGKDFIENLHPLYKNLLDMNKQVLNNTKG